MPADLQIRLQSNIAWEVFAFSFFNKVSNSSVGKDLSREQR